MASDAFRDRMLAATKVVRGQENALRRRIAALYEECAKDLERQVLHYGEDSLTGRRAAELQKSMRGYVHRLWQRVEDMTTEAVFRGAALGIETQSSMLDDALHGIGLTTLPSFRSVFARTQDEAVASVINGTIYRGKHAGLSRRIWNNEALQAGNIEKLIAKAVAEGRSAPQLARDLEAYVNPKAAMPDHWNDIYENLPFDYKVDYNAKRLSVTALNHAYYQGAIMAARENPYAEFLHWELSSAHLIYDVCDTYMEHDEGLGLGNFSLDNAPLPHPFCRCTWYIDCNKSLEEIGQELGRWIAGERNPKLDGAFAEWKEMNIYQVVDTGAKRYLTPKQETKREEKHAKMYYESVRNREHDAERIAENTGWKKEAIEEIRQHVFIQSHSFKDGRFERFAVDYEQAEAWQRLLDGKDIRESDIVFLRHEYVELVQMRLHHLVYEDAHDLANKLHPWYSYVE